MDEKIRGTYDGPCFTPGCEGTGAHIPLTVPSRFADYVYHYRCRECCDNLSAAYPAWLNGYSPAALESEEFRAWDNAVREILALDKAKLLARVNERAGFRPAPAIGDQVTPKPGLFWANMELPQVPHTVTSVTDYRYRYPDDADDSWCVLTIHETESLNTLRASGQETGSVAHHAHVYLSEIKY